MVQSLERAFAVLESFRHAHRQGISQLSERTGLPKTTIHRIVRTLVDLGYLEQDPETAQYAIGFNLITLVRGSLEQISWHRIARQAMRRLRDRINESVYLGVPGGDSVVFVDEAVSTRPVRVGSSIGLRAPLHATAAGKAILAYLPQEERDRAVKASDLERYTAKTVVTREALEKELEAIRARGYSVNDREWVEDACYIAAPVLDADGRPVGAITVGAPAARLPESSWPKVAELVVDAARTVSEAVRLESELTPRRA